MNLEPQPQPQVIYVQAKPDGHGMAVTALVFSIVGVCIGLIPIAYVVAWACGAVAVVLGLIAGRKLGKQDASRTMVWWAVALGLVAILFGIVGAVIVQHAVDKLNTNP